MKESCFEGLAAYSGPESCVVIRKGRSEALTGVHVGWVLSRERRSLGGAHGVGEGGRPHSAHRYRKMRRGSTWSETPCIYGNTSRENREIPRSLDPRRPMPSPAEGIKGRGPALGNRPASRTHRTLCRIIRVPLALAPMSLPSDNIRSAFRSLSIISSGLCRVRFIVESSRPIIGLLGLS